MKTGMMAAAAFAFALSCAADTAIDEVRAVGAKGNVEIFNIKGKIEVAAWDRNEIHVTGTLGRNTERLEFTHDDDETEIKVIVPRSSWRVGDTNLLIQVPAAHRVKVECVSGEVDVRDMRADLELQSTSGGVRATNCKGDIEAKSTSGGVRVMNSAGDVRAESISGSVELEGDFGEVEAESTSGSVRVKTVRNKVRVSSISGSIEVEAVTPKEVECKSTSGSVTYTGGLAPDANLEACTHSGSVKLRLPADVSARVQAETFSGGINNEFNSAKENRPEHGPGATLNTKLGSGSAEIEARAFSGSVTLGKK
jgi:DUF4097 and DUF4098 domain-containing protein YvlB